MKIIIEGCDGSGKTTLANKLAKVFNCEIEHDSTPCDFKNYSTRLQDGKNTIYDRFFLGQFVYNKENERLLTHTELTQLKTLCIKLDVLMIYVDIKDETLLKRLKNRSSEEKEKDRKMMEHLNVDTLEAFIKLTKMRYDWVNTGFVTVREEDLINE